ncbi:MAG TPA: carbohydrate porin [Gammaproteobacteria bacterium]|nr:carbohydrate porin [Gammaproteobacteria bacterium]
MPNVPRPARRLTRYLGCAALACCQVGLIPAALGHGSTPQSGHDGSTSASNAGETAMPARRALLSDEPHAFQWGLHIDTDLVSNLAGGLQRGTVTNSVVHAAVAIDTGALGAWKGGRFAASALRIASGEASANNIGDLQIADNLDAASSTRVYQLWYRQRYRVGRRGPRLSVRGGIIDLNQSFAATDAASLLLNASFGLDPTLSANVPISTYPEPGLGLEGAALGRHWKLQLGIFQPNPAERSRGFRDGALTIGELRYRTGPQDRAAHFKLGLWRYRQSDPALRGLPDRDWGAYGAVEGSLGHGPDAPRVFMQLGHAPDPATTVPHYIGLGLQMPVPGRRHDIFTAGIAHAEIRGADAPGETSYELSYLINLHRFVTLQPDLQYIRHPSGRRDINNAVVALMRLHLEFY